MAWDMYSEQDGSNRQQPVNNGEIRLLYAPRSACISTVAGWTATRSGPLAVMSGEAARVVGFKDGERRIEHFPARNDDDVEWRWRFVSSKQLTSQTFGSVPNDGGTQLSGSGDAKPAFRAGVGQHKDRHEPPMNANAVAVDLFELPSSPNPVVPRKPLGHRRTSRVTARQIRSGVYGPSPGGVSGLSARSWLPCAPESRVFCYDDACLADMSAYPLPS